MATIEPEEPQFVAVDPRRLLAAKVRLGRGIDPSRVAKADEVLASLAEDFVAWLQTDLGRLRQAIDGLRRAAPDEAPARAAAARLQAHDIKGLAGSFGFPLVTEIAASLCRLLQDAQRYGERELAAVDAHVDALALAAERRMKGDQGAAGIAMLRGLHRAVDKLVGAGQDLAG